MAWILFSPAEGNFNRVRLFEWLRQALKVVFDLHPGWKLDAVLLGYDKEQNQNDVVVITRAGDIRHTVKGVDKPLPKGDFRVDFDFDDGILKQILAGLFTKDVLYAQFFWKRGVSKDRDHLAECELEEEEPILS